jgi:hypothetical protein
VAHRPAPTTAEHQNKNLGEEETFRFPEKNSAEQRKMKSGFLY